MTETHVSVWWELLPAEVRKEIDDLVRRDARLQAIHLALEAGRIHGLGVHEAQLVVHGRYVHHSGGITRAPDRPLDPDSLAARAAECPGRVVAIEAVWDGDTVHDWFVDLLAVTEDPAGDHRLATIPWGAAVRFLGEDAADARHPSATAADRVGRDLAARLSVPFHFASPDTPDDGAPRLRSSSWPSPTRS
ncbi:hypothetical protein [Streptomyces fructofermentans]|uniref:hypothetical protein n=1 Tax=Streptomyces fructofermentans TaxID=152141 RepID=UPI0033DD584A